MTDRIETAKEEPRATLRIAFAGAVAGAGAAIAIGAMEWFSIAGSYQRAIDGSAASHGPQRWM
jgi:hypothetical protein